MPVKTFSESAASWERTLVYQTLYENFVVLIQQKKIGNVWTVNQHCLVPKLFINAIAALPNKTVPSESSIITSGGFLLPKTPCLPKSVKVINKSFATQIKISA